MEEFTEPLDKYKKECVRICVLLSIIYLLCQAVLSFVSNTLLDSAVRWYLPKNNFLALLLNME